MSPTRKAPPPLIHAAIYTRGDEGTVGPDVAAARQFAETRGWAVERVFADVTPSRARRSRPALRKLVGLVTAGQVQAVIVPRLSDLFCSAGESLEVLASLSKAGVRLVSTDGLFDSAGTYSPSDLANLLLDAVAGASLEVRVIAAGKAFERGNKIGRPKVRIDTEAVSRLLEKGWPLRRVAREARVSYGTVQRIRAVRPPLPRG